MEDLRGQAVRDVDHSAGNHPRFVESEDHIAARFRLELPPHQVVLIFEVRLNVRILEVNLLFTLQDLQSEVRGTEISRYAPNIAGTGTGTVRDLFA